MPRVSVITPAYNAASTLVRAHHSVLSQTLQDWEHIIVDDGSKDGTPRLLDQLAASDPRVVPVHITNSGQSAALNTGLRLARGAYVAILDADDEYLPEHLRLHVEAMEEQPAVDLFWGGVDVIVADPADAMVPDVVKGTGFIHVEDCVVEGTIFGRRHVFSTFQFNEDRSIWYQDFELVERVRQQFHVERFYPKTYRYYRNTGGSIVDRVKETWPA